MKLEPLPVDFSDEQKRYLEGFAAVGVVERFADSMALISNAIGLDAIAAPQSRGVPSEPGTDHRRIELDLELYAFACERLETLSAAGL